MGKIQTIKQSFLKTSILISLLALSMFSFAQDEGLYPDPPPADAAFVRVVNAFNAVQDDEALSVKIADRDYAELAFGEASDYYVVLQGEHKIVTGESSTTAEILAGRFYTVVLSELKAVNSEKTEEAEASDSDTEEEALEAMEVIAEDGVLNISLIEDPTSSNRAKTLLTLYNLSSSETIDLKTADASIDVILGVAPLSIGNVAVNPIAVDLGSFSGEDQVSEYAELQLQRGGVYSAIVMDGSEGLTSLWVLTKTILDDE